MGGGESHLHSEVDDPLDSHERAQLRHLPAAVTGWLGLHLIQTATYSAPYLSLRLRAATPTNQPPHNSEKANRKRNSGREAGSRGRAAGWRGRCTEVGERAFLGVKFAEDLFILIRSPQLLLSPDLQFTSRFLLSQHSKSTCPCSHAHPVPFFPRPQGLLRLFASAFFLQIPSLSLRLHFTSLCPLVPTSSPTTTYFTTLLSPILSPCAHVLSEFPLCARTPPLPLRLRPLGLPGVGTSLHPLHASAFPANPRGTHLVPGFRSLLLPSHIPSDLLNALQAT